MNRGKLVGIIGGIGFFLIMILVIMYFNSDFDQQLIRSLDSGVGKEKMISQIENESAKEKLKAQKHLESHVINPQDWGNPKLLSEEDYSYYKQIYQKQLETINRYENLRKTFVNKEISKEDFLNEASILKTRLQN